MHYYGMNRTDIDDMNQVEIQGWMAMIPDLQEKFGERKEDVPAVPTPGNILMPNV